MGVGLRLAGVIGARLDDPIAIVERFVRHRYGDDLVRAVVVDDERGGSVLYACTHPAADDVEIAVGHDDEDGSLCRLMITAKTSTVGPGYHADLCEAIAALGEAMNVAWDPPDAEEGSGDETGYFFTGDREALEREMLRWLGSLAKVLDEHANGDARGLQLSMPIEPHFHGPDGAMVLTQLGPRDRQWLARAIDDPRAGIDVFPWWGRGHDAAYELGRVLVHLWLDVRHRRAATDAEERLARELLGRLSRAYALDPSLPYPWDAWLQLHDEVVDADDALLPPVVRSRASGENAIGYRIHDVDVTLAGRWRLTIPGSFAVEIDERGTWSAWEDGHTVWATAFSRGGEPEASAEQMLSPSPREGTPVVIEGLPLLHRAHERSFVEDGATLWQLSAEIAAPGSLLLLTVVVPDAGRLPWARRLIATTRR